MGFVFVNSGFLAVNVSLAETLRSAEPLFSVFFAKVMLKDEPISTLTMITLVPIVLGGVLSSGGDRSFTLVGFCFVCLSNVCFALRSVLTKQLKPLYPADAIQVFFEISKQGLFGLMLLAVFHELFVFMMADESVYRFGLLASFFYSSEGYASSARLIHLILLNGVTYAAYNQMSFLVLSMVSVVTHAVGNSFRRMVTIVASVYIFGNPITAQNAAGILLAIGGVVAYSVSKSHDEAKSRRG